MVQTCLHYYIAAQLTVNPNYAGMFGGKMIDLSGPCFTPNQNIFCRFEDVSNIFVIDFSSMRRKCFWNIIFLFHLFVSTLNN
jgi:hypothetical protein